MTDTHILALLVAVTVVPLVYRVLARTICARRGWTCPRWLGQTTRGYYKLLHGYDPTMPQDWSPHHSLREKKRYG